MAYLQISEDSIPSVAGKAAIVTGTSHRLQQDGDKTAKLEKVVLRA